MQQIALGCTFAVSKLNEGGGSGSCAGLKEAADIRIREQGGEKNVIINIS